MEHLKKEALMAGLFGTAEPASENRAESGKNVAVSQLHPSEQNHFRVEEDAAMEELIASIRSKGVLEPLLVRPCREQEGYEILSGHRRRYAAIQAGLQVLPVIVMEVSDEDRDIILADSNLQRPHIRISEKAWAIRLKYDAIKRKTNGEFVSGTLRPLGSPNQKSSEIIAEQMGVGKETIKRYIRLTHLIQPLLNLVDEGTLPLKAGVQVSYLTEPVQQHVLDVLEVEQMKLNEDLAKQLRETLPEGAAVDEIFRLLKPERETAKQEVPKVRIKVDRKIRNTYFPKEYSDEEMQDILITLLDTWAREHNPDYPGEIPGGAKSGASE